MRIGSGSPAGHRPPRGRLDRRKAGALARRSARLCFWARRRRFDLALAHGSVDLAVVCAILRLPAVQMQDYEFAGLQRRISFRAARRVLVPDAIPVDRLRRLGASPSNLCRYPGLKEDYYLSDFEPGRMCAQRVGNRPQADPGRRPPTRRHLGVPLAKPAL